MNPLAAELTDEAKAELAAEFAFLRQVFQPLNVEQQRFINRHWPRASFW